MRLLKNTAANFISAFIGPVLAIVLTPFYIRHIGLEGYGLVGFFTALTMLLNVFCAAVGKVYLSRMSAMVATQESAASSQSLYFVFRALYFLLGLVTAAGIAALSWWISHRWLKLATLGPESAQVCILLIAVTIMIAFPTGVCVNTLFALQDQVRANANSVGCLLLTNAAAALLVYHYKSVVAYYAATTAGALLGYFLMAHSARSGLCRACSAAWPGIREAFQRSWAEAIGIARSSLALIWTETVGVIVTQTDRLLITSLMPLSSLGIYNTGTSLARPLQLACQPFLTAAYPNLCQLAQGEDGARRASRDAARQQMIVFVIACALCLPFCSIPETLLNLWLKNIEIARAAAPVVAIYAIGNALLGIAGAPYNLAVAVDKTKYAAIMNSAALVWYPLAGYFLISRYDLIGAAILWLLYCAMAAASTTFVAVVWIDRTYLSARSILLAVAVLAGACAGGGLARLIPDARVLEKLAAAGSASFVILVAGLLVVIGWTNTITGMGSLLQKYK